MIMGKLCSFSCLYNFLLTFTFRYSDTLLVTFNNRIALRNMNKDHVFSSGRSAAMHVATRPMDIADIDIESFRAAPNSYVARISAEGLGSLELKVSRYSLNSHK